MLETNREHCMTQDCASACRSQGSAPHMLHTCVHFLCTCRRAPQDTKQTNNFKLGGSLSVVAVCECVWGKYTCPYLLPRTSNAVIYRHALQSCPNHCNWSTNRDDACNMHVVSCACRQPSNHAMAISRYQPSGAVPADN